MREYRKKRKTDADKNKTNEYVRCYRKTRPDELRQNYNAYMREYRVSKASEKNNNYSCQGNDENPQKQPKSLKDLISKFHRIVTNYGISIVCILVLNYAKEIQIQLSIYSTKQVSTILNVCVGHVVCIYLRIKFHLVL